MSSSPLEQDRERLGDAHGDDAAALKTLESGLSRYPEAAVIDRARAMLFRAELAVRLDKRPLAQSSLAEALALELGNDERALIANELAHTKELVSNVADPPCGLSDMNKNNAPGVVD